jgi:tripartite-type tricarboxylate transporter receptor subunit TctC
MPRIRCCRISDRAPTSRSRTAWRWRRFWRSATAATAPAALLAYERLRRERVAQVQRGARENGLRYDSAYSDLGVRDAEITAHAAFRKRLYDHDVVPEAGGGGLVPNLLAGNVDAAVVYSPLSFQISKSGEARTILDYSKEVPPNLDRRLDRARQIRRGKAASWCRRRSTRSTARCMFMRANAT